MQKIFITYYSWRKSGWQNSVISYMQNHNPLYGVSLYLIIHGDTSDVGFMEMIDNSFPWVELFEDFKFLCTISILSEFSGSISVLYETAKKKKKGVEIKIGRK